jgi:hypothetical protein
MKTFIPLPCCLAVAAGACGYGSINPAFVPSEAHYESRLSGTWQNSDSTEHASIIRSDDGGYLITYSEKEGKTARFRASLGVIGGHTALDLVPVDDISDRPDVYKSLLLPLHGIVIIESVGESIRFRLLEPDAMKRFLADEPDAAGHVMQEGTLVLTGSTAELGTFFERLLARDDVLGEENVWHRVSSRLDEPTARWSRFSRAYPHRVPGGSAFQRIRGPDPQGSPGGRHAGRAIRPGQPREQ